MRRLKSSVAAISIAALAFTLTGPAFAAPLATDLGNIDQNAKGTIKIHKYESGSLAPETASPTGTPEAKGAPVPGVVFTAYRITNVDPKKQADWEKMSKINVPADACGANWTTPTLKIDSTTSAAFDSGKASGTTNAQGEASISELPVGLYLLCETQAPASVQKRAMPFLVSMPTPNPTADAANGWLYEVNVYPKNVVIEAPKKGIAVKANGLKTNDQIEYPVTVKVPSIAKTDQFTYFMVNDVMQPGNVSGSAPSVEIKEADASSFTTVDTSMYKVDTTTGTTISFTRVGLDYLQTKPNALVRVTYKTMANTITANGEIPNTATFYVSTEKKPDVPPQTPPEPPTVPPNDPQVPPFPTNTVKSSWGDLVITKTDKGNNKPLSGATFEIYNATDPFAADCSTQKSTGDAIAVDGKTEFTTNAEGKVVIEGLFVDSKEVPAGTAENAMALDHAKRCYVLKETAAPAGYVTPADPFKAVAIQAGTTTDDNVTINNTRVPIVDMPMTGANGRLLMIIGGSALALTALGAAFILAKKRRSQDSKEQ
ncbi:MAG: SpaH/EbpB family LPXTG-anchored major pilin [Schaalia hyovaginalis]|uniref:SpaH/EbpB family LPXTG-anchored major pilin n=1 Tax=Schaalia hyovaginalis TaxID=29316 RepID=UPI002A911B21|nr:SpaH/EbpB family LPXTG-anchored major pilin [Schaalia hyovaginalis]MDY5601426.1 SpaH/EbpB family LPXTG-anchored major pilin [Schaalia hyovaginalis]